MTNEPPTHTPQDVDELVPSIEIQIDSDIDTSRAASVAEDLQRNPPAKMAAETTPSPGPTSQGAAVPAASEPVPHRDENSDAAVLHEWHLIANSALRCR